MAKTAIEQILDEIEARLANITVANGYYFDSPVQERARMTPFKTDDLPAINDWWDEDVFKERYGGGEVRGLTGSIEMHSLTRDEPFADIAAKMAADIQIALYRATTAPAKADPVSTKLGGLVTIFQFTSVIPEIGEGQSPWCGVLITFEATYKTAVGDPTSIKP